MGRQSMQTLTARKSGIIRTPVVAAVPQRLVHDDDDDDDANANVNSATVHNEHKSTPQRTAQAVAAATAAAAAVQPPLKKRKTPPNAADGDDTHSMGVGAGAMPRTLDTGTYLDCKDRNNEWCRAEIVEKRDRKFKVSFVGWTSTYDEWFNFRDTNKYRLTRKEADELEKLVTAVGDDDVDTVSVALAVVPAAIARNYVEDGYGWTVVHTAAATGSINALRLLAHKMDGADVNGRTIVSPDILPTFKGGWTPLYCAVSNNELTSVNQLLELKADPNIADANGWTPLHQAVSDIISSMDGRDVATVAKDDNWSKLLALVDGGADANQKNSDNQSALDLFKVHKCVKHPARKYLLALLRRK